MTLLLIIHHSSFILLVGLIAAVPFSSSAAVPSPDVVLWSPRPAEPGRITVQGRVVEYTGRELEIEVADGSRQKIPGSQVIEVRSTWSAAHNEADELWRRRDYAVAARKYQAAYDGEHRPWAKRLIQSRLVAALREHDQWEAAADCFLILVRDDPATPYFGVVPLPWTVVFPSPALEAKAKLWIADRSSNVASLLGAGFLSTTAEGRRRLNELTLEADPRIALLAEAQLWRTAAVTADAKTVDGWERVVEKMPEPLRAGPTFAVGKAWTLREDPQRAALVLMRVPILFPDEHRLAAESLWSSGQMLERLGQTSEAGGLYRELVREYPNAAAAATARQRLEEAKGTLE